MVLPVAVERVFRPSPHLHGPRMAGKHPKNDLFVFFFFGTTLLTFWRQVKHQAWLGASGRWLCKTSFGSSNWCSSHRNSSHVKYGVACRWILQHGACTPSTTSGVVLQPIMLFFWSKVQEQTSLQPTSSCPKHYVACCRVKLEARMMYNWTSASIDWGKNHPEGDEKKPQFQSCPMRL